MSETEVKISYATIRAAEKIQLRAQAEEDLLSTEELQRYIQEASDAENQRLREALEQIEDRVERAKDYLNNARQWDDPDSAITGEGTLNDWIFKDVREALNPEGGAE